MGRHLPNAAPATLRIALAALALTAAGACASVEGEPLPDAGTSGDDGSGDNGGGKPGGILIDVGSPGDDAGDPDPGNNGGGGGNNDDCASQQAFYPDFDGDGHGDADAPLTMACSAFEGHVTSNDDCDDTDPAVNPLAQETPGDGVDQNCDGAEYCYVDVDDDGYRALGDETVLSSDTDCDDPGEGHLDEPPTDCDDLDPLATPGGVETCNGADDNCDGLIDDAGDCPCPVVTYQGRPYMFCNTDSAWDAAVAQCDGRGYTLATISDAAEDDFVYQNIDQRGFADTWIGFNDRDQEDVFTWISGEPAAYTHWDGGEPNDGGDNGEDCAVIMTRDGRETEWDDRPCNTVRPYVCEGP